LWNNLLLHYIYLYNLSFNNLIPMYGSLLFMLRCIKWPSIVHRAIGTLTPLIQIQDGRYIKIVLVTFSTTFGPVYMQTFFYLLKIC